MTMENLTNVCEATSQSHDIDNARPTHRKGKKLLAEKKRRARINNCLMQIRDLVCDTEEEKDTDLDKMEKAEILEKTLEVLTRLRHESSSSQHQSTFSTRKAMAVRYASGFSSCAEESIRYIQSSRLVPSEVKVQLQNHLRAIARRMEAVVQVDSSSSLNMSQPYPMLPSSSASSTSSVLYDREMNMERLREDTVMKSYETGSGPGPILNDIPELRGYYIPSPIHSSTPALPQPQHIPHNSLLPYHTDPEHLHHTQDSGAVMNYMEMQPRPTEKQCDAGRCSQSKGKTSTDKLIPESSYPHTHPKPDFCYSESSKVQQFNPTYSSPSSDAMYPLAVPFSSPTSTTVILHPTPVHPTSPLVADQPLYNYHGYEPYPTMPSILVQPVHSISTPIKTSSTTVTTVSKPPRTPRTPSTPRTPGSALDLCVKGPGEHKISPETMWRPW